MKIFSLTFALIFLPINVMADCSILDLPGRISVYSKPSVSNAFSLLGEAFERPSLLHSQAFRGQLLEAMEGAGIDAKKYLAPYTETGPIPSRALVMSWIADLRKIIACR